MAMQKYVLKFKRYIKTIIEEHAKLGQSTELKLKRFLKKAEILVKKILSLTKCLGIIIYLTVSWIFLLVAYYFMAVAICLVWAALLIIHYYLIKIPVYILKKLKQKTYPRIREVLDKRSVKAPIQHIKCHPAILKVSNYLKAFISAGREKLAKINHLRKQFIKNNKRSTFKATSTS